MLALQSDASLYRCLPADLPLDLYEISFNTVVPGVLRKATHF